MGGRRWRSIATAVGVTALTLVATVQPAFAGASKGDPSKVGDLTGNFSGAVWLLIPLALILALLTSVALGPLGRPQASARRAGGISRVLSRHEADESPH
jgi:hypothetical protein